MVQLEGGAGRGNEEPCTRTTSAYCRERAIGVIQRVRPGVSAGHEQVVADSAVDRELQTVVVSGALSITLGDRLAIGVGR